MFEEIFESAAWLWILSVAAAGAVIFVLAKKNLLPLPNFLRRPFEELLSTQIVTDNLNGAAVAQWARENNGSRNPVQVLLVKCTGNYLSKLGFRPPEELDAEHNLIFVLTAKDSGKVLKYQLVSFATMDERLSEMFNGRDELLLTD